MTAQPICGKVHPRLLSDGYLIICLREPGHPCGEIEVTDGKVRKMMKANRDKPVVIERHEGRAQRGLNCTFKWQDDIFAEPVQMPSTRKRKGKR